MPVQPIARERHPGFYFGVGHTAAQCFSVSDGRGVSVTGGDLEPHVRFHIVPGSGVAVAIHDTQIVLGARVPADP